MPRSSGPRPNKANKAEFEGLREQLSLCHASEWQRASLIFQDICRLCSHKGSKGGLGNPYPRSCKICNHYGHSSEFCPDRTYLKLDREDREIRAIIKQHARWVGGTKVSSDVRDQLRFVNTRHQAALDAGLMGCEVAYDGAPCNDCRGCQAWQAFIQSYGDAPK